MGYTTDFEGEFELDKTLKPEHKKYLELFSHTRRMKRNPQKVEDFNDIPREAVGLPIGVDGEYFVSGKDDGFIGFRQTKAESVIDYNSPPANQPGLWCQWIPSNDGKSIEWDGNEKFYEYVEWLEYIIKHFLKPWGYVLNGEVKWFGEDREDVGLIIVKNNMVSTKSGTITYQ